MRMREIYCSAGLLMNQHGNAAKAHAAERVQELQASGDEKGAWVWMAIIDAIGVLEPIEPPEGEAVH